MKRVKRARMRQQSSPLRKRPKPRVLRPMPMRSLKKLPMTPRVKTPLMPRVKMRLKNSQERPKRRAQRSQEKK